MHKLADCLDKALVLLAFLSCLAILLSASWVNPASVFGALACWVALLCLLARREYARFRPILFVISLAFFLLVVALGHNPPVSDFLRQYADAASFAGGEVSAYQTEYYGQWPAQFGWSIIEAFLLFPFGGGQVAIKVFECLCSSLVLVEASLLVEMLSGSKRASQVVSCLLALFPTFFLMVGVLSNQVLSALLYLTALLLFVRVAGRHVGGQALLGASVLVGVLLALGNFVRPDGAVILLAVLCCLVFEFFSRPRGGRLPVVACVVGVALAYLAVSCALSFAVSSSGLVKESSYSMSTWKIAVGTNNASGGAWSKELVERSEAKIASGMTPSEAHWEMVRENTKDWQKNIDTLVKKNRILWWGDSTLFATVHLREVHPALAGFLLAFDRAWKVFLLLGLLGSLALMARRGRISVAERLLLLVFVGTFLAYQIIEVQPRYVYFCYIMMFAAAAPFFVRLSEVLPRFLTRLKP